MKQDEYPFNVATEAEKLKAAERTLAIGRPDVYERELRRLIDLRGTFTFYSTTAATSGIITLSTVLSPTATT